MKYPKRSQYKHCKKPYRVRNWPAYDAALQSRGDLTVWFSEDSIAGWHATNKRKRGGQLKYTNLAIETGLTIRMDYKLGLKPQNAF